MSKHIKIVLGALYGDEGKGLITDYFCSSFPSSEKVCNVRFNGGSQAGHTVVTPDGKRHVFSHFGAGSFHSNVDTYLSSDFILNPILFRHELLDLNDNLRIYPNVFCNTRSSITTPYDMMLNQIIETNRGDEQHGSCGVGIYETVLRREGNVPNDPVYIKEVWIPARLKQEGIFEISTEYMRLLHDENIYNRYYSDYLKMLSAIGYYCDWEIFDYYDNFVFEGAQGALLDTAWDDEESRTTPSNTQSTNIVKYLKQSGLFYDETVDVEICYVARTYSTKHGAGQFFYETDASNISDKINEKTNKTNEFQGAFRYGYFDEWALMLNVDTDYRLWKGHKCQVKYTVAITHADETNDCLICQDKIINVKELSLQDPDICLKNTAKLKYISRGETRNHIEVIV